MGATLGKTVQVSRDKCYEMLQNARAKVSCLLQSPLGGDFSDDLTQLSFQGTGPDLEGSVQAWQKRRSSDDAGENSCPLFLPLTPLSGPS